MIRWTTRWYPTWSEPYRDASYRS